MRRCFPAVLLSIFLFTTFAAADVLKIVVDDTIQAATAERIGRAIDRAAEIKADAVLIELDTPGGVVTSMKEIMQRIVDSPIPIIVYVTPSGSRAASAGFFILESSD